MDMPHLCETAQQGLQDWSQRLCSRLWRAKIPQTTSIPVPQ
jgi:hypothetical protein